MNTTQRKAMVGTIRIRTIILLVLVLVLLLARTADTNANPGGETGSADGTCQSVSQPSTTATISATTTATTTEASSSSSSSSSTPGEQRLVCQDADPRACEYLSSVGECQTNADWMKTYCQESCGLCNPNKNSDDDGEPIAVANENDDLRKLGLDLGIPQRIVDAAISTEQIQERLEQARAHRRTDTTSHEQQRQQQRLCRNTHEVCTIWAMEGECERNPSYMKRECAPVCFSCHELITTATAATTTSQTEQSNIPSCAIDPTIPNAFGRPGDVNRLFQRIVQDYTDQEVQVLSSPAMDGGPWLIQMDKFLTPDEAQRLIELGGIQGYEPSLTAAGKNNGGGGITSLVRTSTNAWCRDPCAQDPVIQRVLRRIEDLTRISDRNSEHLQLLKYETGAYFNRHHDCIESHRDKQPGVRILTVFLYLNEVEAGGQTNFFNLNNGITVDPKVGRLVAWPNVQDENPHEPDMRTQHQSLLVEAGQKYAANVWIHQRDYKTADENGCI